MKVLIGPFNQEKALVGAFSVIVKTDCETMDRFAPLIVILHIFPHLTTLDRVHHMFEEHRRATPSNEAVGGHKEIIEVVWHLGPNIQLPTL